MYHTFTDTRKHTDRHMQKPCTASMSNSQATSLTCLLQLPLGSVARKLTSFWRIADSTLAAGTQHGHLLQWLNEASRWYLWRGLWGFVLKLGGTWRRLCARFGAREAFRQFVFWTPAFSLRLRRCLHSAPQSCARIYGFEGQSKDATFLLRVWGLTCPSSEV